MAHRPLRLSLVLVVLALLPFGAATAFAQSASPLATSPEEPAAGSSLCPSDASSAESSSDPESPSPVGSPGPLAESARFETERFVASYQLPEGWQVGLDIPNALQLIGPGELVFVNLSVLDAPIDPDDPQGREPVAIEACASAFIDWLARHPYLVASGPEDVSLGGVSGRRVDVVFMPPDGYAGCDGDEHCLFVLRFVPQPAQFDRIAMDDLEKDRYIALDAHGAVMLVNLWTPDSNPATGGTEATFEEGLQAAQAILDSIIVEAAGG